MKKFNVCYEIGRAYYNWNCEPVKLQWEKDICNIAIEAENESKAESIAREKVLANAGPKDTFKVIKVIESDKAFEMFQKALQSGEIDKVRMGYGF